MAVGARRAGAGDPVASSTRLRAAAASSGSSASAFNPDRLRVAAVVRVGVCRRGALGNAGRPRRAVDVIRGERPVAVRGVVRGARGIAKLPAESTCFIRDRGALFRPARKF